MIAATNKNLEEAIERGEFREDRLPSQRDPDCRAAAARPPRGHPASGAALAVTAEEHNLRPKRFEPGALEALSRYRWRGNIRELRNTIERLMIATPADAVRVEDLPSDIRSSESNAARSAPIAASASAATDNAGPAAAPKTDAPPAGAGTLREFKDAAERAYLVQKLRENNWNISKTAEIIDTPRSNLYKKLEHDQAGSRRG